MGVFDFYINMKVEPDATAILLKEYKSNNIYHETFHFGIIADSVDNEFNAGISSIIDNFLPANILIYAFLSKIKKRNREILIQTRGHERLFDFCSKPDFIGFMYGVWEDKIDFVYQRYGTIILNPTSYYRIRNKLFNKYYKRYSF